MKSLIFSDYELQELKNFYEHQMQKMRERMEHIQGILDKVAGEAFAVAEAVLAAESRAGKLSKRNMSAEEIIESSGLRATKWNKFIINTLLNLRRPLTIQELADLAAKEFGIASSELDKMRLTINQALIRIRKSNAVKEYKIKGLKNKYFGLEAWFDGNQLLEDFRKMLESPSASEKKTPGKRGRKPKVAAAAAPAKKRGRKKKAEQAVSPKGRKKVRGRKPGRKPSAKPASKKAEVTTEAAPNETQTQAES